MNEILFWAFWFITGIGSTTLLCLLNKENLCYGEFEVQHFLVCVLLGSLGFIMAGIVIIAWLVIFISGENEDSSSWIYRFFHKKMF